MTWIDKLRRAAGRWARQGVDLLYPPRCVLCDREAPADTGAYPAAPPVCGGCRDRLSVDRPRCVACAAPLPTAPRDGPAEAESPETRCRRCTRGGRSGVDAVVVLGSYDEGLREQVLRAKRPSGRLAAAGLARLLVDRHRDRLLGWAVDLIVPIPMHWTRRSLRGASSADELARWAGACLGVPVAAAVRRIRATPMQNELPWEERRANVRDAFLARSSVAGRRLLLVDDVTTTGSTLLACGAAATAAGAAAVYAAAVARADRDDDS